MADPWKVVSTEPLPEGWNVVGQEPQQTTGQRVARDAGQAGIGFNDALYKALWAIPDLAGSGMKALGLSPKDSPLPSEYVREWGRKAGNERPQSWQPQNQEEKIANAVGDAVGQTTGTVMQGGLAANTTALPNIARQFGSFMASQPALQTGASAAGAAAGAATDNPYIGAATSLAIPFALHGGQRAISAAPAETTQEAERRALLAFGAENGLGPLTAGKITGSRKLQTGESVVSKLPLPGLGGRVEATEEAGRNAWQGKALEKAGTYGETAATPEVLRNTRERIGAKFDALEGNSTINFDGKMASDLAQAKADFSKQLLDQMPQSIVRKLDELANAANTSGQNGVLNVSIDGTTYKNIRSKLSAQLSKASGTDKQAIGGMIDALDGAAERSLPKDMMKDWREARQQWRNYLALEKGVAANNDQTAKGNLSVAAYGRASRGNKDIERLGQYGNMFVGDKIPNSGTAERSAWGHMIGAGAGLYEGMQHAPGATMAAAAAASTPYIFDLAMNNPATRALLLRRLANPSESLVAPATYGSLAGQAALRNKSE